MRAAVLDRRKGGAEANARGGSIGGQNPNVRTGVIHGGRSVKALPKVGLLGLEPQSYHSGQTTFPTQDDAESDADSTGLDALVKTWGLLTADDRRRIIAIVNGRLA